MRDYNYDEMYEIAKGHIEAQQKAEAEAWYRKSKWRFVAPVLPFVLIGVLIYLTY